MHHTRIFFATGDRLRAAKYVSQKNETAGKHLLLLWQRTKCLNYITKGVEGLRYTPPPTSHAQKYNATCLSTRRAAGEEHPASPCSLFAGVQSR